LYGGVVKIAEGTVPEIKGKVRKLSFILICPMAKLESFQHRTSGWGFRFPNSSNNFE